MQPIRTTILAVAMLFAAAAQAGAAPPPVSPGALDFGARATGSTSTPQTATFTNNGSVAVSVSQVNLSGTAANQYSLADDCVAALAPGDHCEATVTFSPTTAGTKAASLNFVTDRGTLSASITGRAEAAGLSPSTRSFGSVVINTGPGAATTFTVSNPAGGAAAMELGAVTFGGTDPGQFLKTADGCSNRTVELGGSCSFAVRFGPTSTGAKSATLSVPRTGDTALGATLTGTGTAPAAGAVEILPTSISFGSTVPVGSTQGPAAATLYNRTTEYVNLGQATIAGANPDQYLLHPANDQCSGRSIAPGGSCGVTVSFRPTTNGSKPAQLQIPQNGGGTVYSRNLTGTAIAAEVKPYNLSFGSVAIGDTSEPLTGTVVNLSNQPLTISASALAGANPAMYELTPAEDECTGATLAPGASCEFTARFTPTATGTRAASLSFTTSLGAVTYPLTGMGDAIHVAPATLEFGAHSVFTGPSAERSFTVRNADTGPVDFYWVYFSGTGADHFQVTDETCTAAPLSVGATCEVKASFDPSLAGSISATLNLLSNSGQQATRTATATGEAVTEKIAVSPARVDFGLFTLGEERVSREVLVTNTSGGRSTLGQITLDGPFEITADGCSGLSLASAASCSLTAAFTPSAAGRFSGSLAVPVPATDATYSAALLGRAELAPEPPGPTPVRPKVSRPPGLSGKAQVGTVLTCGKGVWLNKPTSFAYSWLRNGSTIKGRTTARYRLTRADVGKRIRCRVTATNQAGSTAAASKRVVKAKADRKNKNSKGSAS